MDNEGRLTWADLSCIDERTYDLQRRVDTVESATVCISSTFVSMEYFMSIVDSLKEQIHELQLRCGVIRLDDRVDTVTDYTGTSYSKLSNLYQTGGTTNGL